MRLMSSYYMGNTIISEEYKKKAVIDFSIIAFHFLILEWGQKYLPPNRNLVRLK